MYNKVICFRPLTRQIGIYTNGGFWANMASWDYVSGPSRGRQVTILRYAMNGMVLPEYKFPAPREVDR